MVGNSHQSAIASLVSDLRDADVSERRTRIGPERLRSAILFQLARLDAEPMSLARGPAKILTGDIFEQWTVSVAPVADRDSDRTRPILKIQDGCNNRCSYCVIPFVRDSSRSLPPDQIVAEIRKLVAVGAKEVVLSGINLGAYGRDFSPRVELGAVVRRILDETGLDRLRFSSIEPQDVTEDFVTLAARSPTYRAALSRSAAIGLRQDSEGDAPLVPHRSLHRARAVDSPASTSRRNRRGRNRRFSRRNRRRFPSDGRFHRRVALHLSARFFVFGAARHRR